jgi:Family of unknown function (DUF6232)
VTFDVRVIVESCSFQLNQGGDMAEERVFLSEEGVVVSNARFSHGGQTYAMANITSVKGTRDGVGLWPLALIIGLFILPAGGGTMVFGLLMVALAIAAIWLRSSYVVLHTSGGEQRALSSRNRDFVAKVVGALNEAIIHRG